MAEMLVLLMMVLTVRVEELEQRRVDATLQKDSKFQQLVRRVQTEQRKTENTQVTQLQAELSEAKKLAEKLSAVKKWSDARARADRQRFEEEIKALKDAVSTLTHEKEAAVRLRDEVAAGCIRCSESAM